MRPSCALIAALVVTTSAARSLGAASASDVEKFKAAKALYDRRAYAKALPIFRAIRQSPNARLYVALCLRELGLLAEAYEEMSLARREAAARADKEKRYQGTRDAAAEELAKLAARIGLLKLSMADPPPEVTIKVAEREVSLERLADVIAVLPGSVLVEVAAPGREPVKMTLSVAAGATQELELSLPQAGAKLEPVPREAPKPVTGSRATPAPAPGPALPETSAPPPPPPPSTALRTAGLVTVGLGAATLGAAAITYFGLAQHQFDTLTVNCKNLILSSTANTPGTCHETYGDAFRTGHTLDTLSNIGLGVGAAGMVAGAVMIGVGWPRNVSAGVSASGGWVSYSASF